jgi:hypothetical protein
MDPTLFPFLEGGGGVGSLFDPQAQIPGVPPVQPPTPMMPPQAPGPTGPVGGMVPESIAAKFAQLGIGPQGVIAASAPGSAGAMLDPQPASSVPMPPNRPMGPPMDISPSAAPTTEMSAQSGQPGLGQRLQSALRGVQAPPTPTPPRVATPSVPAPRGQIKGGELFALLNALGMGQGTIPSLGSALR